MEGVHEVIFVATQSFSTTPMYIAIPGIARQFRTDESKRSGLKDLEAHYVYSQSTEPECFGPRIYTSDAPHRGCTFRYYKHA